MDEDEKVIKFSKRGPEVLQTLSLGGLVDECNVALYFLGDDLDPDHISEMLGCMPTYSHRKGDTIRPSGKHGRPFRTGQWRYSIEGVAPEGPSEIARNLIMRFPTSDSLWESLRESCEFTFVITARTFAWNREFQLDPEVVQWVARIGAQLGVDIYSYGDEE